jgi:hypothetical protein
VNFQVAGQRGLATATRDASEFVLPHVVSQFQETLSAEVLVPITATDVAVFHTPEGELYEKGKSSFEDTGAICCNYIQLPFC